MKVQTRPHAASLPILIPCWTKGEEEGEALILRPPSGDAVLLRFPYRHPVRRFGDADFEDAIKLMGVGGTRRFIALKLLQTAIANKQQQDIKKAREMLCAAVASDYREADAIERSFPSHKQRGTKRESIYPKDSLMDELHRALNPDLNDEAEMLTKRYLNEDPVSLFAMEMSGSLGGNPLHRQEFTEDGRRRFISEGMGVQLILWRSGKRLTPAVYCPDLETAAYAAALFSSRWKVCPYSSCLKWFVPNKAKQDYCCPAHREAHRVARWRERHKVGSKRR
jgi:hypothetical protein